MLTKIATWIYEKMETCTAAEELLLRELIYFMVNEVKKEVMEMKEARDEY